MNPGNASAKEPEGYDHSDRFRRVSTLYPGMVANAYDGDIGRAAYATDEEVREAVATYERSQGRRPRDWYAIGRDERDGDPEPPPYVWASAETSSRIDPPVGQ